MPISRTQQPGMQGTMPPRPTKQLSSTGKLKVEAGKMTKKQLIALCELRGLDVSHSQNKAYYVQKLTVAGLDAPPTAQEIDQLD